MNWGQQSWWWGLCGPAALGLVLLVMALWRRRRASPPWPAIRRVIAIGARVHAAAPAAAARRPWLLLLSASCVVLALAKPRWGTIEQPMVEPAREVMIALDLSRSMMVEDVTPNRLERARLLLRSLIDGLRGERVGLVVFAGTAFVQVPLSSDYQILAEFLPELKPDYMPQGGTDYAGMLRAALGGFGPESTADRFLIVLSDGESLTEDWRQHLPALRERGVRALTLGLGTARGGFIPDGKAGFVKDERGAVVMSHLEPATLQALANETGGVFRDASLWVDLPGLLAETVERGRRGALAEQRNVEHIERFQWLLAPGLLFALLALWREVGVRARPRAIRHAPAGPVARSGSVLTAGRLREVASMFAVVVCSASALWAAAVMTPPAKPADPAEPVRETVARLSAATETQARDWAELAERTLAYGEAARGAGGKVEPGSVRDALEAVDVGERLEADAADWAALRKALEQLLETPPDQQNPQQPPEEQKEKNEQQKDQQQQKPAPRDQSSPQESEQEQKQGEPPEENRDPQKQPSPGESKEKQTPPPPSTSQAPQPSPPSAAMGDLSQDQPPPQPSQDPATPPPPPKTRKIGGTPKSQPADPEEAEALQRLRQVTENDSPARLFNLIEGATDAKAENGRDW